MKTTVVVGTYEKFLFGYEVDLEQLPTSSDDSHAQGEPVFVHPAHMSSIKCVGVSKNGILASGSGDETIHIYDLKKRKETSQFFVESGVSALTFAGNAMVAGSATGHLSMWRIRDWNLLSDNRGHHKEIIAMSAHPTETMALTVSADGVLCLWNLKDGNNLYKRRLLGGTHVTWSPCGQFFATTHVKKTDIVGKMQYIASLWSVADEEDQATSTMTFDKSIESVCFVAPMILAIGFGDGSMNIYIMGKAPSIILELSQAHSKRVKAISAIPVQRSGDDSESKVSTTSPMSSLSEGVLFFSCSSSGDIKLWRLKADVVAATPSKKKREKGGKPSKKRSDGDDAVDVAPEASGTFQNATCTPVWVAETKGRITCMCNLVQ